MTTNSQLFEFDNLKKHIPILGYDEKNSFEQWKYEVKEKLVELLGLPFEKCDSKFSVTEQTELCGYTRIKFTVQTVFSETAYSCLMRESRSFPLIWVANL